MKKAFSIILCIAMLATTLCIPAFAEEDYIAIDSIIEEVEEEEIELFGEVEEVATGEIPPAAICTKIENSGHTFAVSFTGDERNTDYDNWHMDVELTSNTGVTLDARGENGAKGHISVQLPNMEWKDLPAGFFGYYWADSIELNAGETVKVLDYFELDSTSAVRLGPNYHELFDSTTHNFINCGVTLDPDFIEANPDLEMEIALKIYDPAKGSNVSYTLASYTYKTAVAKVGNNKYGTIDEALAAWTNGTTLTLLSDVTLTDVITLKSTEHHILDLGTYTMTAASGKNAIEITACGTGDAERSCITIDADKENPGGINAGNKAIVYYDYSKGIATGNDRPIIKINGGVFNASTAAWGTAGIYTVGKKDEARMAATTHITGGTFNCSINGTVKSKLIISGGTFNYSVGSQGDSTALRLISGGKFKSFGFMTADSKNTKFWIGSAMGVSDKGVYVDDEEYIVIGGPVITEADDRFAAHNSNYSTWSSLLQYSSAKTNGIYYTSAEVALNKITSGTISLFKNTDAPAKAKGALTLDLAEGVTYSGEVELKSATSSLTVKLAEDAAFKDKVTPYSNAYYIVKTVDETTGTITYEQTNEPEKTGNEASLTSNGIGKMYPRFINALEDAKEGDTITLYRDVKYNISTVGDLVLMAAGDPIVIDLNGRTLSPEDPDIPTFINGEKYVLKNGTIEGDIENNGGNVELSNIVITGNVENNAGSTVITSGKIEGNFTLVDGEADITDGTIEGDFTLVDGEANITGGTIEGTVNSSDEHAVDIIGGIFYEDPTLYVADGYEVVRYADYYKVVIATDNTAEASAISVTFKKTDIDANGEDNLEGKDTYNIVLVANEGDMINDLETVDLTFAFATQPTTGSKIGYFVSAKAGVTITNPIGTSRYMFNYNGVDIVEEAGEAIIIGNVTVEGYGEYTLSVDNFADGREDTNLVNATTVNDNLVDYYVAGGSAMGDAAYGDLIINTDFDNTYKGTASATIAVPVRTLTVVVDFPNEVKDQVSEYQAMKVEITGNIDGKNQTIPYELGGNMTTDGKYVVVEDRLVLSESYTVTVTGKGYRTARYTVTMTDDKEINFWNNVKDNETAIEEDVEGSKTKKNFLAGDIVKDNNINIYDLSAVVSYFSKEINVNEASDYVKYDLNRDGVIDSKDVAYVLVSWNE